VQPTVTLQIQRLEREVGAALFDRTTRPVSLTGTGLRLLPEARALLAAADRALEIARNEGAGPRKLLRLGTADGLGTRLDSVLGHLAEHRPDLRVELHEAPSWLRLQRVRDRTLDATFVRIYEEYRDLTLTTVWWERLVVVLPAGHPAANRPALRLPELKDLPLRLVNRADNPAFYDLILGFCQAAGFEPVLGKPFTTVQNTLAEIGFGDPTWGIFYEGSVHANPSSLVTHLPTDPPLRARTSLAVRDPNSELSQVLLEAARLAAESNSRTFVTPFD
jgi:DNA-binding transcriptional LysR family regulator